MSTLPQPDCPLGYPVDQIEAILGTQERFEAFGEWFTGQTGAICDGRRWNRDTGQYEETGCGDNPHVMVVYRHDFHQYVAGRRVVLD